MIVDNLHEHHRYNSIHPGFSAAFEYLCNTDLDSLPEGRHEITKEKLIAISGISKGKGISGANLEVHRKFIDIQYVITGKDTIGWRSLLKCTREIKPYDENTDAQLFYDTSDTLFDLNSGCFAIFFPMDAHAPLAMLGVVNKIVLKIATDW